MIKYLLKLNPRSQTELSQAKRELAAKFRSSIPTNSQIIEAYLTYARENNMAPDPILLGLLKRRQVRTISGVAPVAILTKPYPCPGKCAYCPNEKGMPKSYLSNEPAVMRAILNKFDPRRQIVTRIKALEANGHPTDKIELIIMGGTWSYLPKNYQLNYIIKCFQACNEFSISGKTQNFASLRRKKYSLKNGKSAAGENANPPIKETSPPLVVETRHCLVSTESGKSTDWQILENLQKQNETSAHRIVGLTLETRPDYITPDEIKRMRAFGCTRVELGVQAIDDEILKLNDRGHGVKEIITATKLLREAGFKICYHIMVGLPGSSPKKDLTMFKELFSNPDFQPDHIKIYPCVITRNARIYQWYKKGKYKPYTEHELVALLAAIKKVIPPYVRIIRVIRDIPTTSIVAGNKTSNLREDIARAMKEKRQECQCIRCREIKDSKILSSRFMIKKYEAGSGTEYFLSYEDIKQNKIIAFLRLRLPHKIEDNASAILNWALKDAAIIREVHTYGPAVQINKRDKNAAQHSGLGKKLIEKAEKISYKKGYRKIAVISGIGVREYYKKMGYKLKETYMVKNLMK